jgi:hypothetical protein
LCERFSEYPKYQGRVRKLVPWIYWSNPRFIYSQTK